MTKTPDQAPNEASGQARPLILHAGLIACRAGGAWLGALILGPSGSGKSDLTLRALDHGFALVADDRVLLFASQGRVFGRAPAPLRGLLEARGVGVARVPSLDLAPVSLVVRCTTSAGEVERMAETARHFIQDIELPRLDLWPLEISAPAKLRLAMEHLGPGRRGAYGRDEGGAEAARQGTHTAPFGGIAPLGLKS